MPYITLLIVLAIIGVIAWAVTTYIPMPPGIRNLIIIVAVVVAVIYALNAFGITLGLGNVTVPHLK